MDTPTNHPGERPGVSGLTRDELRGSLRQLNLNIWLRAVCDTFCGGATFVFVAFALALGIERDRMGLLNGILGFACVLQVAGLMLSRRAANKKRYVLALAVIEPAILLTAVLVVPFLPPGGRFPALAVAMFAAAGLLHLTRPLTEEWSAAAVPAGLRGRYLGRRLQVLTLISIGVTLLAGVLTDAVPADSPLGFGLLMAAGAIFGWLAVLPLRRVSLPALSAESRVSWSDVTGVWRHRPFRRFLVAQLVYLVPFVIGIPYYQVYNLKILGLRATSIALMQIGYMVAKVLISRLAGRWVDRLGPRRALLLVSPIYIFFFTMHALAGPERYWLVVIGWAICGIADGFYFIVVFSSLYASLPSHRGRSAYFAVLNLCQLSFYAIGAILAMVIVQSLAGRTLTFGPLVFEQYQLLYGLCTVLMLGATAGALLFPRSAGRRDAPARQE